MSFPGGSVVKNMPANAGDTREVGSVPGLGRFPGGGMATHSSILEIAWTEEPGKLQSMGSQSWTWLSARACARAHTHTHTHNCSIVKNPFAVQETRFCSLGWQDPLEVEMTNHSSCLEKVPWTEEPGGLQSMGLQRVGHNWVTKHIYTHMLIRYATGFSFSCYYSRIEVFENFIRYNGSWHCLLIRLAYSSLLFSF